MTAKRKLSFMAIFVLGSLFLIILVIGSLHLLTPYVIGSENTAKEYFDSLNIEYEESFTTINDTELHWVKTGNSSSRKLVLFLHGTPGSWMDFNSYLSDSILRSNYQLIAIDRPGQGLSNAGKSMVSILEQTNEITQFVKDYNFDSLVVVGYSYGGPIAGALAANRNLPVSKLVLLSPANGPACEPIFWFNKLLDFRIIGKLFPRFVGVANDEKIHHAEELKRVEGVWKEVDAPVIHVHSEDDWIAPYTCNVSFSRAMINNAQLKIISLESDPHFLPNTKVDMVRDLIVK